MTYIGPHPWDAATEADRQLAKRRQSDWAGQLQTVLDSRERADELRRDADEEDNRADTLRDALVEKAKLDEGSPTLVEDLVALTGMREQDVRAALLGEHGL